MAKESKRPASPDDSIGRSVGNWARVVEIGLACWLAVSPFVFRHPTDNQLWWVVDWSAALVLFLAASASYWAPLRGVRWVNLGVALALIAFGYLMHSNEVPPPALQNHISIGFLLLMMAFIPNDAGRPGRAWYETIPSLRMLNS